MFRFYAEGNDWNRLLEGVSKRRCIFRSKVDWLNHLPWLRICFLVRFDRNARKRSWGRFVELFGSDCSCTDRFHLGLCNDATWLHDASIDECLFECQREEPKSFCGSKTIYQRRTSREVFENVQRR